MKEERGWQAMGMGLPVRWLLIQSREKERERAGGGRGTGDVRHVHVHVHVPVYVNGASGTQGRGEP